MFYVPAEISAGLHLLFCNFSAYESCYEKSLICVKACSGFQMVTHARVFGHVANTHMAFSRLPRKKMKKEPAKLKGFGL
jgi:hypothetical protein